MEMKDLREIQDRMVTQERRVSRERRVTKVGLAKLEFRDPKENRAIKEPQVKMVLLDHRD